MSNLQDLPTGKKFTAKSFEEKLRAIVRSGGNLNNLQNNPGATDTIDNLARERQSSVRSGGYNRFKRELDYKEVLGSDSHLTEHDKKDIEKILEHWSAKPAEPKKVAIKKEEVKKRLWEPISNESPLAFLKRDDSAQDSRFPSSQPDRHTFSRGSSLGGGNLSVNAPPSGVGVSKPPSAPKPPTLAV